jgi:hypothetical protein
MDQKGLQNAGKDLGRIWPQKGHKKALEDGFIVERQYKTMKFLWDLFTFLHFRMVPHIIGAIFVGLKRLVKICDYKRKEWLQSIQSQSSESTAYLRHKQSPHRLRKVEKVLTIA